MQGHTARKETESRTPPSDPHGWVQEAFVACKGTEQTRQGMNCENGERSTVRDLEQQQQQQEGFEHGGLTSIGLG